MSYHYRYINLPRIPKEILDQVNYNFSKYKSDLELPLSNYTWSDNFNSAVNEWCQQNICREMYWAFQVITGDLPIHTDRGTKIKFCYLLDTGGDNVSTNFYDSDNTTLLESIILEEHRWHILKVDVPHSVSGVNTGKTRFSITGRIF